MRIQQPVLLHEMADHLSRRGMTNEVVGENVRILGISPVESCEEGDITLATSVDFLNRALSSPCAAVLVARKAYDAIGTTKRESDRPSIPRSLLVTDNAALAHAWLKQRFADWKFRDESEWGRIHPSAVIHPEAQVHGTAIIGPNAVIGRGAVLGSGVTAHAGVIVEAEAVIGEDTLLHAGVMIARQCRVGRNCIIRSGTIIGSEGMGFAQDERRRHHRIPQTGIVVIEDDCVLGANNCIDRATYGQTLLRRGTIMDNMCHLAHNVEVGEDSIILACTTIAGSTRLGNRVICSGQTGILDHLTIPDDTVLLLRAAVVESIEKPGVYAGQPLMPIASHHRLNLNMKNLGQALKDIKALEKRLAGLEGNAPSHSG